MDEPLLVSQHNEVHFSIEIDGDVFHLDGSLCFSKEVPDGEISDAWFSLHFAYEPNGDLLNYVEMQEMYKQHYQTILEAAVNAVVGR